MAVSVQDNMFFVNEEIDPKTGLPHTNRDQAVRLDLKEFRVNTSKNLLGPSDNAREIVKDLNHPANTRVVTAGPIGLK